MVLIYSSFSHSSRMREEKKSRGGEHCSLKFLRTEASVRVKEVLLDSRYCWRSTRIIFFASKIRESLYI